MSYAGKLLRIDLTKEIVNEEPIDRGAAEKFIGGRGYAAKILFDELMPKGEPLSPENKIVFMTGPLTGLAPASNRCAVLSKSPVTGGLFDSNIGEWGVELKKTGYDGVIVEGKSKDPVYISIKDSEVELKDASRLWGTSTSSTVETLRKADGTVSALCIGVAGENLVKLAIIMDDGRRAAGRGGIGAVMGSKNLKAIAVKGSGRIKAADERAFKIHLESVLEKTSEKRRACTTCPTACSRAKGIEGSKRRGQEDAANEANLLCNELGLDMLSVGRALGIMKSSERDLLIKGPGGAGVSRLIEDIAHGREMPALIEEVSMNNKIMRENDDISAVIDSLGLCRFAAPIDSFDFDGFAKVLNSATGFQFDGDELIRAGERICELERRFSARELEKH